MALAPLLVTPLLLLMGLLVAYGMFPSVRSSANAFGSWVIGVLNSIPGVGPLLGTLLVQLTQWIAHELGAVAVGLERRVVGWFGGLLATIQNYASLALAWPYKLFQVTWWLLYHEIPRLIGALPTEVSRIVRGLTKLLATVQRSIVSLWAHLPGIAKAVARGLIDAAIGPFLHPLRWLRHVWRAISHAAAHAGGIAAPWIELPRIGKTVAGIRKQLWRMRWLLAYTGAAGLVAAALGVKVVDCVRRGNIAKAARSWCGLDSSWVDSLLTDLLTIASVLSVVEFAKDLRAVEDEALKILAAGIREFPS